MLDISLGLLLFVATLFLGLIYLLNTILYQPLLGFMEKREKSIKNDMAALEQNSGDISAALDAANEKISLAKSQAAKIKDEAISQAKSVANAKKEEAVAGLESQYVSFLEQLMHDKNALKEKLSSSMPSFQDALQSKIKNI